MENRKYRLAHTTATQAAARLARAVLLATVALGAAFDATRAQAATDYIDPAGPTLYNPNVYGGPQLNGAASPGYRYNLAETSSSTSTAPTGCYWIETSWGVSDPAHATNVAYSVNGVTCQTVTQTKDATGAGGGASWSGFKALNSGQSGILFLTNGISQITSTRIGAGNHTRGLWRTTRLTGTLINPSAFGSATVTSSSPGNGRYYFDDAHPGTKSFAIGASLSPGVYKLEISWGVFRSHCSAVTYSYNQTGADGFAGATAVLAGVNQQGMNDGRAYFPTNAPAAFAFNTWSGFRDLGTFTVEAGSQIWLSGSGTLTLGVIQATPVGSASYIDPHDGIADHTVYTSASICGPVLNNGAVQTYDYNVASPSSWISRNTNGNYWVEVSWGVNSAHNTNVAYSVDGTTYATVNQTKNAIGGDNSVASTWSGFKALNPSGTNGITLNSEASAITATGIGVNGGLTRALWRVSPLTGILINPASYGIASGTSSSPGNGNYYYTTAGTHPYAIGSALAPGVYKVEISWGVNSAHSPAVTYSYNRTGAGGSGSAVTVLTNVNQTVMNDGRAFTAPAGFASGTWSGFKTLGTFTVQAGSQIYLTASTYSTMGVIQATWVGNVPPLRGTLIGVR